MEVTREKLNEIRQEKSKIDLVENNIYSDVEELVEFN